MSKVISAPEGYDPEVDRHAPCGKRVFDADRVSNKDNTLIGGGADRIDQWKATTQSLYDGDASDKDRASRRKAINIVEPDQMVNTVTGELMGEYGTWKADLERKKRQKEQDILDDAEDAKVPDDPVMARLKSKFKARGANGIVGLGRLFRIMDDDRSGCLCFAEFKKAMKECNMEMNDTELMVLFKRFGNYLIL